MPRVNKNVVVRIVSERGDVRVHTRGPSLNGKYGLQSRRQWGTVWARASVLVRLGHFVEEHHGLQNIGLPAAVRANKD